MKKITIVGAGGVGSQTAFSLASKKLAEIVLIDVIEGLAKGRALDIFESLPFTDDLTPITGTKDFSASINSDIVIITAGLPRKPGMGRDDLLHINSRIMKSVVYNIVKYSPESILIVITNPLDAMVHLVYTLSGFPKKRVIGLSGVLDSARFRAFVAQELHVKVKDVEAIVLGSHSDLMVPLVSHCRVNGVPLVKLLPQAKITAIVDHVRGAGGEIVELLGNGSSTFATALAVSDMIESIVADQKKILPCAVLLEGEYDVHGLFVGVPVVLGKNGVEKVMSLKLNDKEKSELRRSVRFIQDMVKKIPSSR